MNSGIQIQVFDEFAGCVDAGWLAAVAEAALDSEGSVRGASVSIVIADDETVTELNAEHRGLDDTTDVLSFSNVHSGAYYGLEPRDIDPVDFVLPPGTQADIGEVIISMPQAVKQAGEAGHTAQHELAALVAHGIFHLLGYDHEEASDAAAMRGRERAARECLLRAGLID